MKVVVTGATGFIGKHVVNELNRLEISPTLIVRSSAQCHDFPDENVVAIDLKSPPLDCYKQIDCPDVVIHLAWDGLPNYNSLHHFEDELPNHYRFLKNLVKSGLKTLVVAGTCFEYGMQSGLLREDLQVNPTNSYGFAKNSLRSQLAYLQQTQPFNLTWARLFYIYGDGQSKNSLFSQLNQAIDRKEHVFNMSGGEQLRDYLPVQEVAKYLVALALTERNNEIVNICSGIPISVRKLIENWIQEKNYSLSLNLGYYSYPDYEPMALWGDRQKLDLCLGKNERL